MPFPICIICKNTDSQLKIQCDGCKRYLHVACAPDAEEVGRLTRQRARGTRFFCDSCDTSIDQFAEIKLILSSIASRLEKLELNSAKTSQFTFEETVREAKERAQRENNVIVYGVAEESNDRAVVAGLMGALSPGDELIKNIVYVSRLGKIINNKPRPLRVTFNNPYSVGDVLRLNNKLKSIPLYKNITLRRDRTVYQVGLFKECQNRVNQLRNNGILDVRIKYVHGVPEVVQGSTTTAAAGGGGVSGSSSAGNSGDSIGTKSNGSSSNQKNP